MRGRILVARILPVRIRERQQVEAPQRQVFDVAFELLGRGGLVVIVEVGREVDAAHRALRNRRATPGAGREPTAIVARASQEPTHTVEQPSLVVAEDPDGSARSIDDLVPFRPCAAARELGELLQPIPFATPDA